MQINIFDIRLRKVIPYIGWILLLLLLVFKCNNVSDKPNTSVAKYNVKTIEKERKIYIDSFSKRRKELAKQNEKLIKDVSCLKEEIIKLKQKKHVISKDVEGLVEYYNNRYKTQENKVVENKVGLTEEVAYDVSFELEEFDNISNINKKQESVIAMQDSLNNNLTQENKGLLSLNELTKKELEANKDYNNVLEKDNKKLKRKNTFNKYLIPASFILGAFTGQRLIK